MLVYPSPRLAVLVIVLIAAAGCGYFWAAIFDYAALAALLLGLVALFDLLQTARALSGKLELRREFPTATTVAQVREGRHVLDNRSRLPVVCRAYEDSFTHMRKELPTRWQHVRPRGTAMWPLRLTIMRRGEQDLGGAGLRVLAGLGLWVLQYRFALRDKVRVYPLIEELTKGDLFAHRRKLWGLGQHRSRKFGRGTEFEQLRDYTPDDEFRQVNWKATARKGAPVVNQFQVEQARDLMLLVDCGRLMHTEIDGRPRLDRYLDAATHLAYLALSQRDRVGLIAFDAELRKFVAPSRSARQLDNLIDAMFDLQPRFVESDYSLALSTLKAHQPKRGMVVLFTDLLDSISSRLALANLSRLARTHLPVVVILDDPQVARMAEQDVAESADAYMKASAEQFISEKRNTLTHLRTRGCLIVNVTASRLNGAVVDQYLQVKARNML
jgi:uncharacterized protein (DUF58 family)